MTTQGDILCNTRILGHPQTDEDHHQCMALLAALNRADNLAFVALFQELCRHTEAHFERENRLMAEYGFPALTIHRQEHARLLGELRQMLQRVETGKLQLCRAYVRESLPAWFNQHIQSMDAVSVRWLEEHS